MIDPSARIEAGAAIGQNVSIGPYCTIGPHVTVGDGCRLLAHVNLTGHTTIGARTVIHPFASLGSPPQSVHYRGGPTRLVVGADCDIREGVTMNTGTEDGGGVTRSRRPLFPHGRRACRARLQGRQQCRVRQQHGARRPRQRRRPCGVRRRRGGAPVRAHRRGRHDRGLERRARRRHPLGHGAGAARESGRPQRRSACAGAGLPRPTSIAIAKPIGRCFSATANSAPGSSASPPITASDALVANMIDFIRAGKRPLTMAGKRGEAGESKATHERRAGRRARKRRSR